jgi:hypothetical protein
LADFHIADMQDTTIVGRRKPQVDSTNMLHETVFAVWFISDAAPISFPRPPNLARKQSATKLQSLAALLSK